MIPSQWGIDRLPFSGPLNARLFHQGPTQDEALARLHFLVDHGHRLGLVLGGSGTGKSWLLGAFAQALRGTGPQLVDLSLTGLDTRALLWHIAAQLGTGPAPDESLPRLWRRVGDRLVESRMLERPTVMLLDDADTATRQVLTQVVRLAEWDRFGVTGVTLVLVADPSRLPALGPRLVDLAAIRIDVYAWQEADTVAHLESVLAGVGDRIPTFQRDAIARLHTLAAGVPRRINQLADLALLASAGNGSRQIDAATVAAVFEQLRAHPPRVTTAV